MDIIAIITERAGTATPSHSGLDPELKAQTPLGIETGIVSYQSTTVTESITAFVWNLIAAVAIVIVVLMIFMGLRSGLLIGFILLLTILGTFILMKMNAVALQRISLDGKRIMRSSNSNLSEWFSLYKLSGQGRRLRPANHKIFRKGFLLKQSQVNQASSSVRSSTSAISASILVYDLRTT